MHTLGSLPGNLASTASSKMTGESIYWFTTVLTDIRQHRTNASADLSGSFAPVPQFPKWEIHTVFQNSWNFESAQNLSLSFLADLWGAALNPRARFCAFRFMKALAAHRVFFASAAVALPGAGCRHMGERAALAENPPGLGDGPCLRIFLSMTRRFPPYSDNEKDSKDGSQTDYFHGHRGHHY